jgi:hypothetical protein
MTDEKPIVKIQKHKTGTHYVTIPAQFADIAEQSTYLECSRDNETNEITYRPLKR